MSQLDRRLLDEAGLTIVDAARLFARSRQALYTGLASERAYFSPQEVKAIVDDARQRDSSHLYELIRFIEANYPNQEQLLLPEAIGRRQLQKALEQAKLVVLSTSGNTDHFTPNADFRNVLSSLVKSRPDDLHLVIPAEWVIGSLKHGGLPVPDPQRISYNEDAAYLPSFAVLEDASGQHRAFVFGRMTIEEMLPGEADRLWTFLMSTTPAADRVGQVR